MVFLGFLGLLFYLFYAEKHPDRYFSSKGILFAAAILVMYGLDQIIDSTLIFLLMYALVFCLSLGVWWLWKKIS